MDLRTRTSLFCGALALAIAVSVLLRGRTRRAQIFFALFALDIGLWYLAQWLYHVVRADVWERFTAVLAVLLPQFALHLFEAIFPRTEGRSTLLRVAGALMVPAVVVVLSPLEPIGLARGLVFLYVFGLIAAGLISLLMRGENSRSRATQRRVRFLVLTGALATAFSLADFLWFIGAPLPPVGAVLAIVFLFVLAESLIRDRLIDAYEMGGMAVVSTALAFTVAGIFYVFVVLVGGFQTMYLNAILASIVILTLFEPLRDMVSAYIHRAFRERVDLERAVTRARRELANVLEVDQMLHVVVSALENSRRATAAALYLRDPVGLDYDLAVSFGPPPPSKIGGTAARPLIDRLSEASIVIEEVIGEVRERTQGGSPRQAETHESLLAVAELLGPFKTGVCVAIRGEDQSVVGILTVADDRVSDAFSPEDVALLESLAVQIGVVIENSRQYRRLQERDRLAALGQMAAGLAHEVKNPLGAIKGAAQLLGEPHAGAELDASSKEFINIILEEVDRLDRVVGSVLDYARPSKGNPGAINANAVVARTVQVVGSSREPAQFVTALDDRIPPVRADEQQLRQVLMNLIRNAMESMEAQPADARVVTITTRRRASRQGPDLVEIAVQDHGPGIPAHVLKNLFVPFFTTKHRGTGLGLAISQRVVQDMGGHIEVASQPGLGSIFTVVLPSSGDGGPSLFPSAAAPAEGRADVENNSAVEVKPA